MKYFTWCILFITLLVIILIGLYMLSCVLERGNKGDKGLVTIFLFAFVVIILTIKSLNLLVSLNMLVINSGENVYAYVSDVVTDGIGDQSGIVLYSENDLNNLKLYSKLPRDYVKNVKLSANSEVLDRVYLSLSNKKISFLEFLDWYSNPSLAVDYKVTKNTASFEVSGDEISVVSDTVKVLTGRGNIYSSSTFLRINGVLYKAPINIESQKSIIDDRIYILFFMIAIIKELFQVLVGKRSIMVCVF